jgi:SAM-dependent methyltransferase
MSTSPRWALVRRRRSWRSGQAPGRSAASWLASCRRRRSLAWIRRRHWSPGGELAASVESLRFEVAEGTALPFGDHEFDAVVLHRVLCHVPRPDLILSEAFRVLRATGKLAVFDGDYATITLATGANDPPSCCVAAFQTAYINDPWLVRRLPSLVRAAGFSPSRMRSHGVMQGPGLPTERHGPRRRCLGSHRRHRRRPCAGAQGGGTQARHIARVLRAHRLRQPHRGPSVRRREERMSSGLAVSVADDLATSETQARVRPGASRSHIIFVRKSVTSSKVGSSSHQSGRLPRNQAASRECGRRLRPIAIAAGCDSYWSRRISFCPPLVAEPSPIAGSAIWRRRTEVRLGRRRRPGSGQLTQGVRLRRPARETGRC